MCDRELPEPCREPNMNIDKAKIRSIADNKIPEVACFVL